MTGDVEIPSTSAAASLDELADHVFQRVARYREMVTHMLRAASPALPDLWTAFIDSGL